MVAAVKAVAASGTSSGTILLSAVVGECDALGLGTAHALSKGLKADACINGEPTELKILTDHAGVTQLDITVQGRSVHVYERARGIDAIEKMCSLLRHLDESILTRQGGLDRLPTLNVGTIDGGSWPSLVAASCRVGIDVRSTGTMTPNTIKADVERFIARLAAADPDFVATVELRQPPRFVQQFPYHADPAERIVEIVARHHRETARRREEIGPSWPESFYGTDASHIARAGIPTVIYGPGSHHEIGQPDEYVRVDELVQASNVYARAAQEFVST
jgi:acetylornithine deacetylase